MAHNKCRINVIRILGDMYIGNSNEAEYIIKWLDENTEPNKVYHVSERWVAADYFDYVYSNKSIVEKIFNTWGFCNVFTENNS